MMVYTLWVLVCCYNYEVSNLNRKLKPLVYFCVLLWVIMSMFIGGDPSKMAVRTEVKLFKVLFLTLSVSVISTIWWGKWIRSLRTDLSLCYPTTLPLPSRLVVVYGNGYNVCVCVCTYLL